MRCIHFALCTVIVQFVSAAVQSGEGLRASLMSRHFSSIMERQGGRTKIVDELESNLRAKLHMGGVIKSTTTKT